MSNELEYLGGVVNHMCQHPKMYVGDCEDPFAEIELFLNGIDIGIAVGHGKRGLHLPSAYMIQFHDYLKENFIPEDKTYSWACIVQEEAKKNEEKPFEALSRLFSEFVDSHKPALKRLAEAAE